MMKWEIFFINFSKYFRITREKLYSKLIEAQNLRKIAESFYNFLATPGEAQNTLRQCN